MDTLEYLRGRYIRNWKQCLWEGDEKSEGQSGEDNLLFTVHPRVHLDFYSSKILWVTEPLLTRRQEPLSIWNRIQLNELNLHSFLKILWDDVKTSSLALIMTQRNELPLFPMTTWHWIPLLVGIQAQLFPPRDSATTGLCVLPYPTH